MAEIEITVDRQGECPPDPVNNISLPNPEESSIVPFQPVHNSTDQEERQEGISVNLRRRFFKVPTSQRRSGNTGAFDPHFVSFGPYHAGAACLSEGEELKRAVAQDPIVSDVLRRLVTKIQEHELQLRYMYIQMSEAQHAGSWLAELLALDSILLVNNALRVNEAFIGRESRTDALLLENQVPIFVLKYALESLGQTEPLAAVLKYYHTIGASLSPFHMAEFDAPASSLQTDQVNYEEAPSLLGSVYNYLIAGGGRPDAVEDEDTSQPLIPMLPTASDLAKCGLRFKPCNSSFCGIEWRERSWELCLPRIKIGNNTLQFLHNLLAYEATAREAPFQPVTSYTVFMDGLMDTEEDVQILVDAGVVTNLLGSHQELAFSWKKLCTSEIPALSLTAADRAATARVAMLTRRRWHGWRMAFKKMWHVLVPLTKKGSKPCQRLAVYAITALLFISLFVYAFNIFIKPEFDKALAWNDTAWPHNRFPEWPFV